MRRSGASIRTAADFLRGARRYRAGGDRVWAGARAAQRALRKLGAKSGHGTGPATRRHEGRRRARAHQRLLRGRDAAERIGKTRAGGDARERRRTEKRTGHRKAGGRRKEADRAAHGAIAEYSRTEERVRWGAGAERRARHGGSLARRPAGERRGSEGEIRPDQGVHREARVLCDCPRTDDGRTANTSEDRESGGRRRVPGVANIHGAAGFPGAHPATAGRHRRKDRGSAAARRKRADVHFRGFGVAMDWRADRELRQPPAQLRRKFAARQFVAGHRNVRRYSGRIELVKPDSNPLAIRFSLQGSERSLPSAATEIESYGGVAFRARSARIRGGTERLRVCSDGDENP